MAVVVTGVAPLLMRVASFCFF
ncbi:hypothetical protein CCACVL1_15581 [Corchorus capsularis]|uniref:Uncharacterized protein n=1 Tax=Corchorus capsularis TaxID=210143 RepID=A0A1R3I1U4_COCAP|nr:hypothetical protein CCACVL1_15581 [Corchorus capsularis]